jgi:hypothetical protein
MAWLREFFGPLESMDKRRWGVSSEIYLSILVYLIQSIHGRKAFKKGKQGTIHFSVFVAVQSQVQIPSDLGLSLYL